MAVRDWLVVRMVSGTVDLLSRPDAMLDRNWKVFLKYLAWLAIGAVLMTAAFYGAPALLGIALIYGAYSIIAGAVAGLGLGMALTALREIGLDFQIPAEKRRPIASTIKAMVGMVLASPLFIVLGGLKAGGIALSATSAGVVAASAAVIGFAGPWFSRWVSYKVARLRFLTSTTEGRGKKPVDPGHTSSAVRDGAGQEETLGGAASVAEEMMPTHENLNQSIYIYTCSREDYLHDQKYYPFNPAQLRMFQSQMEKYNIMASGTHREVDGVDCAYYRCVLADTLLRTLEGDDPIPETNTEDTVPAEQLLGGKDKVEPASVHFHQEDMLKTARSLLDVDDDRHVAILNAENKRTALGGAFGGAPNQEEDLARSSQLGVPYIRHAMSQPRFAMRGSPDDVRPHYGRRITDTQANFTPGVCFYKEMAFRKPLDRGGSWLRKGFVPLEKPFRVSIVGNAALNLSGGRRGFRGQGQLEDRARNIIRAHVSATANNGVTHPVFTNIGCGAFNNSSKEIGALYYEVLYKEGYAQCFKEVHFSIIVPEALVEFQAGFNEAKCQHAAERAKFAGEPAAAADVPPSAAGGEESVRKAAAAAHRRSGLHGSGSSGSRRPGGRQGVRRDQIGRTPRS